MMDKKIGRYGEGKIRIILKDGFTYIGKVIEEGETFIRILDKYGKRVFLTITEIKVIQELDE